MRGLLQHLQDFVWKTMRWQDDLVNVLGEPIVTHGKVALVSHSFTPAVFDTPLASSLVREQVDTSEDLVGTISI